MRLAARCWVLLRASKPELDRSWDLLDMSVQVEQKFNKALCYMLVTARHFRLLFHGGQDDGLLYTCWVEPQVLTYLAGSLLSEDG